MVDERFTGSARTDSTNLSPFQELTRICYFMTTNLGSRLAAKEQAPCLLYLHEYRSLIVLLD
jgi:hypothetical protein